MNALIIGLVGLGHIATAIFMFFLPQLFFDTIPGVSMMGPFNLHFIRDAGLAFFVSGGAFIWGWLKQDFKVAFVGALWPCCHALLHVWIWVARGLPVDEVAMMNAFGIQLPAWVAFFCVLFALRGAVRARA